MGVIEDVRKVVQDLVTPDLKAPSARVEALSAMMEVNNRALNAKIDANHATVINALNIDKCLEALEGARDRSREIAPATS